MTTITLSEKQKEKLLEMAKYLFPEYIHDGDYNYWSIDKGGLVNYWKYNNVAQWSGVEFQVHWFEFCMTHLVDKIWAGIPKYPDNHIYKGLGEKPHVSLKEYLITKSLEQTHPVDFLYNEFIKLK